MNLRQLQYFMVVAKELHFSRAAARLHIEASPLSRAIKELEEDLGIQLFNRDRRGTRLTHPGQVFLDGVERVFTALDDAAKGAKAAALGYRNTIKIALSDGSAQPRLAGILARCRAEQPEIEIRLTEVPLSAQLRGLRDDTFHVGFARSADVGDTILAQAVWSDPLVVTIPTRHPLLTHAAIPLSELLRYPLVMCHPELCTGYSKQIQRILRNSNVEPIVIEHVTSTEMMLTLVAAGYGLGFAARSQVAICKHSDIVLRSLATEDSSLTTYLLTPNIGLSPHLEGFISRVMESTDED